MLISVSLITDDEREESSYSEEDSTTEKEDSEEENEAESITSSEEGETSEKITSKPGVRSKKKSDQRTDSKKVNFFSQYFQILHKILTTYHYT